MACSAKGNGSDSYCIGFSMRVYITVRQYRGSGEAETACPEQETDVLAV
ncbi:hypothetical protein [Propionispira raffinosivorans]|nr:hypothetical protein [Propionispira raffinosivorans]